MTSSNTVLLSSNKHSDHSTLTKIPTGEHERRLHNVSPPPAKNHIPDKWEAAPIDAALHTSLDAGTSTLLPFNDRGNKQQRNDSDVEAFVPFCTSTPPSTPQRGEGHKRTAPTITDVVKLDIFKAHAKFMPSPTVTPEATIELPLVLKPHSPSLKRKSAHSDLQSPSTLQHSLDSITASPFGVRTKLSQMPIMKPVSPLRIVKRHSPKPVGVRASTTSEVSKAVISAVRDAFVEARDADADEEGTTVRELINRDSVWTCDGPHGGPTRYNMLLEGDESDEEHGQESPTIRATPCTPPPPYAFKSPGPGVLFRSEKEGDLMPSVFSGIMTPQVTELLRLETTSLSSVDSCLDDIIVSFEHLMTIVPNLNSPLLQDPLLSAKGSDKNTADARILANGNITGRCSALSEAYGGCVSQWSDVLRLDSY
ncbi:hypothetical protein H0H81_012043 [Sphagnurus paluster]|uniref:Uncharacterized protein n=1 Tax=Sphagnurus paluster TaxID=117069 RepID=A0A9P7FUU5_9AGAR|nr:hypothetical protein H0H81_012043 [Sphagnurus paluster]